jgi:triacylglycerol esterase/lipase EstA (alpha/beta hydrolase family)
MATMLRDRGFPTVIVPLRKRDWLPTLGGRSMSPILRRLDACVQDLLTQTGAGQINLVAHSAGGWLARIYLGDQPYCVHPQDTAACRWHARPYVATLISLGTPHTSQERWTRKNLDFVNLTYPGAFYAGVRYVCVAGKAIFGDRWRSWLAYSSYELTCGQGNCWGDGITPIVAAHLEGAENLTLDQVRHSPRSGGIWYGSPDAIATWATHLA